MLLNVLRRMLGRTPPAPASTNWQEQALALQRSGRHEPLIALCRTRLEKEPDDTDALNLLAAALCASGQAREGAACLRQVCTLLPAAAAPRMLLATVLAALGDTEGALENYRSAAQLDPSLAANWVSLCGLLQTLGRYDEAETACRSGLIHHPGQPALHHTLGQSLFEQGRIDEAMAAARTALAADPDNAAAHSDLLRMMNYAESVTAADIHHEHIAWGTRHADPLASPVPHPNEPNPARRLRVGFVSPYFCKHAMTFFFESTIAHHDRKQFEYVLYADVARPDEYSARLREYGAAWHDTTKLSDEQLAQAVRADGIDILVDLSGHTPRNRLLAFARRPAPVQITWNGYPNTTGMRAMDGRITDAWCDPPGKTEALHSETLLRLPRLYMTWQPPPDAPEPGPLPAHNKETITFGSFNSCFKITAGQVALWARILQQVPHSKLKIFTVSSAAAEHHLRALFTANGIAPERLELLPRLTHDDFLRAHRDVDIALDTFPYHGTTTTCFSLWMGVPVVVRPGDTHVSRVGVSLLQNTGLPELVAHDADDYVAIAVRLAGDRPALAALRAGLRERLRNAPLTDGRTGARAFESALRQAWSRWCVQRGRPLPLWTSSQPDTAIIATAYGPLAVSRNDTMIAPSIAQFGHWEQDEIELLRWFTTECWGSTARIEILDIGAFNGVYAVALARFPFPEVEVHAFEAQRAIHALLEQTVALNGLDNVRIHHRAVSDTSGTVIRFPAVDYAQPANFGALEIEPARKADFDGSRRADQWEEVATIRIDELALQQVKLMKIDAEGMEHKVLAGAAQTIRRCRPLIFVEYEKTDFEAVKAFLRNAGYRAWYAQRPNILCLPEEITHIRIDGAKSVDLTAR